MSAGRIKIGQIGIAHNHGHEKMCALKKLPRLFEIVGVAEQSPQWREKRGALPGYAGLDWLGVDELLAIDGLQAVLVESDVPDLNSVALRCLRAGKHIHMDKPPCGPLEDFREVLDEASRCGLVVQMGYMFRGNPAIRFCIDAVKGGLLGRVFEVDAVMSRMDGPDYRKWLSQFAGGAFFIFGCHLIDLVLSMLGRPDKITAFMKRTQGQLDNVVDSGLAVLEYEYATAAVRAAVVEVDGFLRRQMTVCGDKGTIEIYPIEPFNQPTKCLPRLRLTLAEATEQYKAGTQEIVFDQMHDRYTGQLSEFAGIIRGEIANPYPPEYELMLQGCLLAACEQK